MVTKRRPGHSGWSTEQRRQAVAQLRKRDGSKCWLCKEYMHFDLKHANTDWYRSIDHVIRPKDGGSRYDLDNMKLAHRFCNSARHSDDER